MTETHECENFKRGIIALDLGGTWIKGCFRNLSVERGHPASSIGPWPNPARNLTEPREFACYLSALCGEIAAGRSVEAVCIATAGEVCADCLNYKVSATHLGVMCSNGWQELLASALGCPIWLINDAEAFMLGAAEASLIPKVGSVAGLLFGTGVGFSIVRDGRWWRPSRRPSFLGSIQTPLGDFDHMASAVGVAAEIGGKLRRLFSEADLSGVRDDYIRRLAQVAASAAVLFHLDHVIIAGGVSEAAGAGYPLASEIQSNVATLLPRGMGCPEFHCAENGNRLILEGAVLLALGNLHAEGKRFQGAFSALGTEIKTPEIGLERMMPQEIVRTLWKEEQKAGEAAENILDEVSLVAGDIADVCRSGGRVIYVGAGTSGRVAALDAVEMPCTYGVPRWQFVAVIAGGVADASLSIEEEGEEDTSSVPDLLLLQSGPMDIVVGITASGTAFFVRSAMAFAQMRGARTVLLHEAPVEVGIAARLIQLCSGAEVVSGSTRMKAGTATKKILNFVGTTAMILLGKTHAGRMIEFDPSNEKLVARAVRLLSEVHEIDGPAARELLQQHNNSLRSAMDASPKSSALRTERPATCSGTMNS